MVSEKIRDLARILLKQIPEIERDLGHEVPVSEDEIVDLLLSNPEVVEQIQHLRSPKPHTRKREINPIWTAELAERLQFDGDVPEFRRGRLQVERGQRAAVPVDSEVSNPLMLGAMLKSASDQVTEEAKSLLLEFLSERDHNTERYLEGVETALVKAGEEDTEIAVVPEEVGVLVPQPKSYPAGEIAKPVKVGNPSALELSKVDQSQVVWSVTATTQGRKSAIKPIERLIEKRIRNKLPEIVVGFLPQPDNLPVYTTEWKMNLDEVGNISPRFSAVELAAAVLAKRIALEGEDVYQSGAKFLAVHSLDRISDRVVGWTASLYYETPQRCLT